MKQKIQRNSFTIIAADLNIPLLAFSRTTRQRISKDIGDLKNIWLIVIEHIA